MTADDLEDLTLLIVGDADEAPMWTERWAVSYPLVRTAACRAGETVPIWRQRIQAAFDSCRGKVMAVGYGAGAAAYAAWYFQTDTAAQRRTAAVMMVSPPPSLLERESSILQRVRFNCPAALVIGQQSCDLRSEQAQNQAQQWRARLLVAPQQGCLNGMLGGWQWGMKLMQQMLLAA